MARTLLLVDDRPDDELDSPERRRHDCARLATCEEAFIEQLAAAGKSINAQAMVCPTPCLYFRPRMATEPRRGTDGESLRSFGRPSLAV